MSYNSYHDNRERDGRGRGGARSEGAGRGKRSYGERGYGERGRQEGRSTAGREDRRRVERSRYGRDDRYNSRNAEERSAMEMQTAEPDENRLEGRNAVLEAFRSGRTIDRLYVQEGLQDGPVMTILREAAKHDTIVSRVTKERLDQMSQTHQHQGVIAQAAAFAYATVEDIMERAKASGRPPFIFLLDNIEDPHNLGAIIRTANLAGAHGVIIPKRRASGLTATVVKASAGAINYTPVAKVTNLGAEIDRLKEQGLWFVCADMGGEVMYRQNLTGPIGLVIGSEGEGVSRLIKEKCDYVASIPMNGDIDSLNASVAAGVLAYEIVRQRMAAEK